MNKTKKPPERMRIPAEWMACGFLLSRGISGAAQSARWSMSALLGTEQGSIYGAMLFALSCAVVWVVRNGFGRKANAAINLITLGMFVLWQALACLNPTTVMVSSAIVAISLWLTAREKPGVPGTVLYALVMLASMLSLVTCGTDAVLRLTALLGGMASAGMTGTALHKALHSCSSPRWQWLVVGAALGLI